MKHSSGEENTYGPRATYTSQTSGGAPSAGSSERIPRPVRVLREAWMMLPLYRGELHHFDYKGRTLMYDVHSGAFFEADDAILDVVDAAEGRTLVELFEIFQDKHSEKSIASAVKELREEGILSESPIAPAQPPNPPSRLEITRLDLIVTTDVCTTEETNCRPIYMDERTGQQAIDILILESGLVRDLQIAFVGGEPLLNAPLVLRLIDYAVTRAIAAEKRVTPLVVTDGSCLNDRLCGELEQRGAVIRLVSDGTSRTLDGIHGSGQSSLATSNLADRDLDLHLRIEDAYETEDPSSVETILDRYPRARSVSIGSDRLASIDQTAWEDLGEIARARWTRGQNVRFREIEDRIDQLVSGRVAAYHDADGLRSIAVDTSGDIYVSRQLIGIPQFRLGNCATGFDGERQREWIRSTHIRSFDTCRDCWARHLCAGGPRAQAYLSNGDVHTPDPSFCRSQRHLYEISIGLYTELIETHPEVAAARFNQEQAA